MANSTNTARCNLTPDDSANAGDAGFFTIADTGNAFCADLLDEAKCRAWVLEQLHPAGAYCPCCHVAIEDRTTLENFHQGERCRCKNCGKWFTATSRTFLQGTQLSYRQVYLLAVLADFLSRGIDISSIGAAVGVSADTVRLWIRRFEVFNDRR